MSTPNLEAKIALAWETFADYSNNEEKTDQEVIEQEAISDQEMVDVLAEIYSSHPEYFSHPPGKPNRRRP
jgi:hypothetical protein